MKLIGVAGYARAGKDTFCTIAKDILEANGYRVKQYSFAKALKDEVAPFLRETCGADVWTSDTETKTDFRDFLVWYGTTWWRKRDPQRWIRGVDVAIKNDQNCVEFPHVALVSDVRYPNEGEWVHSWQGYLVHVAAYKIEEVCNGHGRYDFEKVFFNAPNEQERINDPIVKGMADYKVQWEAKGLTLEEASRDSMLREEVLKALNSCDEFSTLSMPVGHCLEKGEGVGRGS